MKRNMNWGLWMSLLVTVIVFTLKIPTYSKILLLGLFIAGMLYLKRSIFYYVKANRKITSENEQEWDQAWPLYRKAIKAGLQKSFVITSASMFLQRGDALEGKAILEQYLATSKGKDSNLDNIAKTMVSMAYWMDGDLQKAIRTVEEVYESGYRDKNLFINYTTYALENGDLQKAEALIDESGEMENTSPGIKDNRGWLHIVQGEWDLAEALFSSLIEKNPRFPEPYVHYAQVHIHYGEVQAAIDLLKRALKARFSNTSGMKQEQIQQLLSRLETPETRLRTAKEIDADPVNVASGRVPKPLQGSFTSQDAETLQGFAARPKKPRVKQAVEKSEERLPNTDLTEEDLEYIRKHNLEET